MVTCNLWDRKVLGFAQIPTGGMGKVETDLDKLVERCKENLAGGMAPLDGLTSPQADKLLHRYWRIHDDVDKDGFISNSAVEIHSLHTPRPVLHMMCSNHANLRDQWATFWDQQCGGFSCVDSVLAGRMTSHLDSNYVPTCPTAQDARSFYIHEELRSWPMFPIPGFEEDQYSRFLCRQGLDQFDIRAAREHLACSLNVMVHSDLPIELWQVTLANNADEPRKLSWFFRLRVNIDSYPFYYFVPRVVCEGIIEQGAMVFLNHDKSNKHPRAAMLASAEPMDGFDMMGETFDGASQRSPIPRAVAMGQCSNSLGLQPYAGLVAAGQFNCELQPGQQKSWTLAYGKCPTDKPARKQFLSQVSKDVLAKSGLCLDRIDQAWRTKISAGMIRTGQTEVDRYYNVWSRYQLRNQVRFVRGLDKIGYRDVMQDLLGVCEFEASYARARILEALRYQFPDGRAVRQYEACSNGGHDARLYQDSPVWIAYTLHRYLAETGDLAILEETVPFTDPETLQASRAAPASVYQHALLALRSLYQNTGHHGLCRIGYGDWNDALSGIGGRQGVSVWLSCACVHAARMMSELAGFIGQDADRQEFASVADDMAERINAHAWDGRWYVYAMDDNGQAIGSSTCDEGRIHLNVNTWAIFSGVAAAADRAQAVWAAVEQLATPVGHMLLSPPYSAVSRRAVGRIADVAGGMFENGSIYTHGEAFYLYALAHAGKSDTWLAEILKTLPTSQVPDISTAPPHQQSNFFVGPDHTRFGENLFSNFTGSVTWYRLGIEMILGAIPELGGLRIAPRPPKAWQQYELRKLFRGRRLHIVFRPGRCNKITLNGDEASEFISADHLETSQEHRIEVEYETPV